MKAWELDTIITSISKDYFGLQPLVDAGALEIEIEDALAPEATVPGGFAGIIVDLFTSTQLLPELQEAQTWRKISSRLKPGGRIVANLGDLDCSKSKPSTLAWEAMQAAFPGAVMANERLYLTREQALVALTGPMPTSFDLPETIKHCGQGWVSAPDFNNLKDGQQ